MLSGSGVASLLSTKMDYRHSVHVSQNGFCLFVFIIKDFV